MPTQALKDTDFTVDKITIEEFHNLYIQNIKGSFFKNDAIRKSYLIEGVVCPDVFKQQQGTNFKIQSDEGNILNVYIPKKISAKSSLEPGNKVKLYGMFNLYDSSCVKGLDFLEFKASRVMDSGVSQSKKEIILDELNEKGFLDKSKKKLHFNGLDYFRIMVITSKDNEALSEINSCFSDSNFFQTTVHYIDSYTSKEIANTIMSFDKNNYYDALLITDVGPDAIGLFDEMPVLSAIFQSNTLIINALGHTLANQLADIVEDGPISAAKMLLYEYKEEKLREGESQRNEDLTNSAYISVLSEKEEMEKNLNYLLNEKVLYLTKIKSQQKFMILLGLLSTLAIIITLLK